MSRWGVIAFASSLDQVGPLARTVEDAALLLEVIAGLDPRDATSIDAPVPRYRDALTGDVKGLRIGIPHEYFDGAIDADIRGALERAKALLVERGARARRHLAAAHARTRCPRTTSSRRPRRRRTSRATTAFASAIAATGAKTLQDLYSEVARAASAPK